MHRLTLGGCRAIRVENKRFGPGEIVRVRLLTLHSAGM
jgi:hypothetical protein